MANFLAFVANTGIIWIHENEKKNWNSRVLHTWFSQKCLILLWEKKQNLQLKKLHGSKLNGTGKFWKQTIAKRNSEITPFVSIYSKSKKNVKYNDEIPFYIHTYTYTYLPTYIHTLFGKEDW